MQIGELAKAAGVQVQTIRFYERRGLLPPPPRLSGGYRDYRADMVPLVRFIKQVQAHGYALEEIRESLYDRDSLRSRDHRHAHGEDSNASCEPRNGVPVLVSTFR